MSATLDIPDLSSYETFVDGFPHDAFVQLREHAPVWWHEPTERTPDGRWREIEKSRLTSVNIWAGWVRRTCFAEVSDDFFGAYCYLRSERREARIV